ncbi:hypothetical protein BD310DRAFT_138826 [Dichomitus squalens]|uniref:Uncharacterized protein n=1 Tax=Dichomitus squalens TaxID=114155 RepID=A0A4Q9PI48_9APHY|nr:hypothetical protein BD310DRAFT_138826 [Dichomitus squalens]
MPRTTKSSLVDHRFPAFYACYLLKSVRTPRSTATPSPPRRIRQHNGIISQGAWKTKQNRPWVMQMIVHGFPSKLAALQFEWAWQHPDISRHLRDNDGQAVFGHSRKLKFLRNNVKVARSMVSSHPYNTWPLSVKIFTAEAEKAWIIAGKANGMPPLPIGIEVATEFEGVDGKSGITGSGRTGPIDVTDAQFTSEHLRKASSIFVPGRDLRCLICHDAVQPDADPLTTALCLTSSCTAVSHLSCLSRQFLGREVASTSDVIPRGGKCDSCNTYILWGDIIRGCYRRRSGGETPELEQDVDDLDDGVEDRRGRLFGALEDDEGTTAPPIPSQSIAPLQTKKHTRARASPPSTSKAAPFSTLSPHELSDERDHFDLCDISSDSSDEQDPDNELPQWHSFHPFKTVMAIQGSVPPKALSNHSRHQLRDGEDLSRPHAPSHTGAGHGTPPTEEAADAEKTRFDFTSAGSFLLSPPSILI